MVDLIDRQAVQEMVDRIGDIHPYRQIGNRESYSQYNEAWTDAINRVDAELNSLPSTDAVEVVRCKDCKHRWVNEHYGEKGYMKIKAMCSLDTDDPFELGRNAYDDNWFCADGERKDE